MADRGAVVDDELLAGFPLPSHGDGDSKYDRGTVLVAGGSDETPGAVILAGLAALRAGAGKLQLAVPADVATAVAVAVPEARVLDLADSAALDTCLERASAVLVGPGVMDLDRCGAIVAMAVEAARESGALVLLDAGAVHVLADREGLLDGLDGRAAVLPNGSEFESLGAPDVTTAARRLGAVVTCRNAETEIAAPDGRCFVDTAGHVGLATSGAGDVLSGIVAGLAARGADPLTAVLHGCHAHGLAGERLAARWGGIGFLARELLDEVPAALHRP